MDTVDSTGAEKIEVQRDMSRESRRANFTNMFAKVCREADFDDRLRNEEEQFQEQQGNFASSHTFDSISKTDGYSGNKIYKKKKR
jgi:hypothetical protein